MSKIVNTPRVWEQLSGACKGILLGALALVSGAGAAGPHPADPSATLSQYLMYGEDKLEFKYQVNVNSTIGKIGSQQNLTFGPSLASDVFGAPIVTRGTVTPPDQTKFSKDWLVDGSVAAPAGGSSVVINANASATGTIGVNVTGTKTQNSPAVAAQVPVISIGTGNYVIPTVAGSSTKTGVLPAGSYGDVSVSGELILGDGDYEFQSLTYQWDGKITIRKSKSGVTRILVKNNLSFSFVANGGIILDTAGGVGYGKVLVYCEQCTNVTTPSGTPTFRLDGTIFVPKGTLTVGSDSKIRGQLLAKNLIVNNALTLDSSSFQPFDPENVSFVFGNSSNIPEEGNPAVANGNVGTYTTTMTINPVITSGPVTIPFKLRQNNAVAGVGDAALGTDIWLKNGSNCTLPHSASATDSVGSVTFPANTATQNITFCVNNDNLIEGPSNNGKETLKFIIDTANASFSRALVAVNQLSYDLTIVDDIENRAPEITSTQDTIQLNEDFGTKNLLSYFNIRDLDGNAMTWSAVLKHNGTIVSLNQNNTSVTNTSFTALTTALGLTSVLNQNGTDTLTVTVSDGSLTASKDLRIIVNAVNDAPVGTDKAYSTNEDVTLNVAANGILAGATDVEGNTITAGIKTVDVKHGTLTINSDGSLSYVPTLNFNGLDTAKVQIADGNGGLDTIQVVFTVNAVNDAPLGTDKTYSTNEDVTLNVAAAGVLSGATDAEGNTITVAAKVVDVKHGTLTANANGSVVYVPNANFFGADTARLQIADGQGGLDTIQVVINVNSVNDIPVGADKAYSTNEDVTLNVSAANGALSGATDADGDALTASKIVNVKNGTLTVNADGSMVYVPNLNFNGLDTAKVQIADGNGGLDTVQVVFTVVAVNDAPVGADKTYSTNEDVTLNVAAAGVLSGATDVEGNAITVSSKVLDVKRGALTANADGSLVYVPNANFFGADTARLQIADGQGGLDTIQVVINVNEVNDTATALGPKTNTLAENSAAGTLVVRLTTTDAADALVPETFSYSLVDAANNDGVQFRISGDSLLVANGAVLNFEAKSTLKLVVKSTDRGGSGIAIQDTITVNLTDVNETPVRTAHLSDLNLLEEFADTTVADLSTKFSDPDAGDVIGYSVSTSNGKLSARLSGNNLVLQSAKDSVGSTLVYITATDKAGLKAYDTLTVNIANVNDNPVLNDSAYSITENSAIGSLVGRLNPYDVDVAMGLGDALTLTQLSNSKLFVIKGDSILSRADLDYEAVKADTLLVEVSDKAGLKDTARVIIQINNVIEKSRLNIIGANSTSPNQNAWLAVRDTVLGHVTITHGNSGIKGLDTLWTKDTSFVIHYTEDGRLADSNLVLGSELTSKGYGVQVVNRIYQNPTKDLADTIRFVMAYNTKIPTLAIDTTVKKFKKDSNGRIWVNDSIMKKDQGKFDWDISTVGSDPFVRVKIDSVVRAQLAEGENTLIVAYTDRYGNVGYDTIRVMVDTKYPLVRIDSPRGPKGEDTSKVFSLGVGVNWTVDGVKQTVDTIQGLVEGANVIVRGNCDYAGNCAYDTVWVDALFEDNRIKVQVKDAIIGLTNGKVVSEDEQAQKEQEYYQERNQARGESEVIPTQEGYNLTLVNTQTGKAEEILYYNGSNQKKIDSNRRVGLDTNLSIGPRVKVTMQFPLIDDSVGSCKDGKPMWEFNVNAIDANIYDQIGQFVSSVHVPGFVVDKKAYQQSATDASPGTVDAFLELPKVRNDMRSINGQRWGDGVYLINIRVRTTAKGINCNAGKLNPASISTMTKVGYVRAK